MVGPVVCQGQQGGDGEPSPPTSLPDERQKVSLPQPKLSPSQDVSELSNLSIILASLGSFLSILLLGVLGYFSLNR